MAAWCSHPRPAPQPLRLSGDSTAAVCQFISADSYGASPLRYPWGGRAAKFWPWRSSVFVRQTNKIENPAEAQGSLTMQGTHVLQSLESLSVNFLVRG